MSKILDLIEDRSNIFVFKPNIFDKKVIIEEVLYVHHENSLTKMDMFRIKMEKDHIFLNIDCLNPDFEDSTEYDLLLDTGFFCIEKESIEPLLIKYVAHAEKQLAYIKQVKVNNIIEIEKASFKNKLKTSFKRMNKSYIDSDDRDNVTIEVGFFLDEKGFRCEVLDIGTSKGYIYNSDESIEEDDYGFKDYKFESGVFERVDNQSKVNFMTTFLRKQDFSNTTVLERRIIEEFINFLTEDIQKLNTLIGKKWSIEQKLC